MKERKYSTNSSTGYILSTFSSILEGFSEGSSAGLSIYTSLGTSKIPAHAKITVATSVAAVTGVIHSISNFCFQGSVIRNYFSQKNSENHKKKLLKTNFPENISKEKKYSYFAVKYGYSGFALSLVFFELYLLYSATKAWISDFNDNENIPLTQLSSLETSLLVTYYLFFDVPFILTNQIMQTCEKITELFDFSPDALPDQNFLNKLQMLAQPFAKNNYIRKFIRISGSATDTFEHVWPLLLIIPSSWVVSLSHQPSIYIAGIGTMTALSLLTITATILAQTYLFEGRYSEENLKNLAWKKLPLHEVEEAWIHPRLGKFLHFLLNFGGPLYGVDLALTFILAFREMQLHPVLTYSVGGLGFVIGWLANHFSEVKESQESLQKITKLPLEKLMSGSNSIRLFKKGHVNYGAIDNNNTTHKKQEGKAFYQTWKYASV